MIMLITGGAGFIGSNLAHTLIKNQWMSVTKIIIIDNLILGQKKFIEDLIDNESLFFYQEDLLNLDVILKIFEKHRFDLVWHLAANSDISYGAMHTDWDLRQNTLATYNVLECMRRTGTKKIVFASTSAIYGMATVRPTPEEYGPLLPISFYGASKLAAEGLITAFSHNFDFQTWMFRFGNIVGKNGTHGVIVDFIKNLRKDPSRLKILGNGKQAKPYLYVQDCVEGIIFGYLNAREQINFFNLSCAGATSVKVIADLLIKSMKLSDVIKEYTGGEGGWIGDVPQVLLAPEKLEQLGWKAKYTSDEAVNMAIKDLIDQIQ